MGYIDIPVYQWADSECYPGEEEVMEWFADIHTGSRIDFSFNCKDTLQLYNCKGAVLGVKGYDRNSVFRLIEPKTSDDRRSYCEAVKQKCSKTINNIEKNLPGHVFTDRELYDIYLNSEEHAAFSKPAWIVGNIRLIDVDEPKDEDNAVIFCVSMEIRAKERQRNQSADDKYRPIKHEIEDKLTRLYRSEDDILIPESKADTLWRKKTLRKMIFSLKGDCDFADVDALTLRRERILETKYPWRENEKARLRHPRELIPDDIIYDVTYDFPVEESWSDVIEAMGEFFPVDDDLKLPFGQYEAKLPLIKICEDNIKKTVAFMQGDPAFQRDIMGQLKIFGKDADAVKLLREMVVAHELGHMTFRNIKDSLSLRERESLANWFSCLFADSFDRMLVALIVPYQSEEYQDFIEIPEKSKAKRKQYNNYCDKVRSLLRSW